MNLPSDYPYDIYRGFERVLIAQNRIENALEVAEQGRFRAINNLLVTHLAVTSKLQHISVTPSIDKIQQIAKVQNSTLVQYSLLYDANQMYQLSRFALRSDRTYAYAEALFIWVIQPTGEISFRQVNLKHFWRQNLFLASVVRNLREFPKVSHPEKTENKSNNLWQQLYQLLIEPIADLLPKEPLSRIIFIPQDFLFLVPFSALQDSTGTYLIEKYLIRTAPSIQILDISNRNRKQEKTREKIPLLPALIVGNPAMPSIYLQFDEPPVPLPNLPRAEKEAKIVAKLLGSKALIGTRATKKTVMQQMKTAKVIHLATHGLLDYLEELSAAIALAPSCEDDGFLRLSEIMAAKLNAELTVISACDTSRGKIWGDGVALLSQAFIAAGVSSLILSLWASPDTPVDFLMSKFYTNLLQSGDKALSLRNAMLATMQQYPAPRNWAAFTLIGEAD
ncbi:MAG: CHAT domain-containing protein [Oscillatoriaceae bacterium SKW80]|nr:CHAT domain-containing protein [Oscillatoriaceae bacterium SKYG93]MCX8120319.1 CHAT domain-containing protein [Oscillatoriaceae bacterium SKW80]MDW8453245.1 CHAT domain-containing protein [Oscillatoriaceae cyanobacterium SKYGB_i_bin93]HIK27311.1 CHAT domain-containing protein [Oscillatoriaceae cyanobacterium M7585_C2015_266]